MHWDYPHISGTVIHGKHLGRTIGFPTANVAFTSSELSPATYGLSGIVGGKSYYGIGAYIHYEDVFESHFFDFSDDIYGEEIFVKLLFKIRDNQKFSSLDALKEQIEKDKETMLSYLEDAKKWQK